eukprot:scaffold113221_cov17-Tisochrysis_lutea.AAC.1
MLQKYGVGTQHLTSPPATTCTGKVFMVTGANRCGGGCKPKSLGKKQMFVISVRRREIGDQHLSSASVYAV